jgi:hypothetical protein
MSTNYYLLPKRVGLDPKTARLFLQAETRAFSAIPPALDAATETKKRTIADALRRLQPAFREAVFRFDDIAKFEKFTSDEARRKFRHIEVNGRGIQITIFDEYVHIARYFGMNAVDLDALFAALCQDTGYVVYDPQLERVIDPKRESLLDD